MFINEILIEQDKKGERERERAFNTNPVEEKMVSSKKKTVSGANFPSKKIATKTLLE